VALPKAGTAILASLKRHPKWGSLPKAFGTAVLASLKRHPKWGSLPKAFQNQTSFAFGFFAPRLFTKASFRHILETKKPITL
jgi:hypothetical protein